MKILVTKNNQLGSNLRVLLAMVFQRQATSGRVSDMDNATEVLALAKN